jgi:hypothetical protein
MLSRLHTHVRHNVVGYLALFFALSGTALGANAALKVGDPAGGDLTGSTYPDPVIAADKVNSGKVLNNSLTGDDIANGAVGTADLSGTIPAARMGSTNQLAIQDQTFLVFHFPIEAYDTANLHSTSTNTSRLTAPVAGIYRVSAFVTWADDSSSNPGYRELLLSRNGAGSLDFDVGPGLNQERAQHLSTDVSLAEGGYVEIGAYQTSGGVLSITAWSFTMSWVAPG